MKKTKASKDEKTIKQNIFPSNWKNPRAVKEYDVLIVGAGPGGMTAAMVARSLNASVAIVEKEHFGGECFSYGCIPSKALLRSSKLASEIQKAKDFGLHVPKGWKADFKSSVKRVHALQAYLSPLDSAKRFKELGVDVFLGVGHFINKDRLQVGDQTIRFKKAIIATGTHPVELNVPGLERSDYLTNEEIFKLSSLPKRLAVIGGGPIGCELSQAFLTFGSDVTLVTRAASILPREDHMAFELLQEVFKKEGMKILTRSQVLRVEKRGKQKVLFISGRSKGLVVDKILVAIGRQPSVSDLKLGQASVIYDAHKGIATNDYQQTSNPNIYAAGDVASPYKFTHISEELCTMAVMNALEGNERKTSSLIVPWCTFTEPGVAHIGLSEEQAKEKGFSVEAVVVEMSTINRAILDGEATGFVKILVRTDNDQIVGATVVAAKADYLLAEISLAMKAEKGLVALSQAIHCFPSQSQVLRTAAQNWLKKRSAFRAASHLKAAM